MDGSVKGKLTGDFGLASNENRKKPKTPDLPFTVEGNCDDEIKLAFDNGKTLFVSKNFLVLSSPVFAAMFKDDFIERGAKRVPLPGKSYDDFLEFLLCMNPACEQKVNESNVLSIAPIADEYQVNALMAICKSYMEYLVKRGFKCLKEEYTNNFQEPFTSLKTCLNVLHVAISLSYKDLKDVLVNVTSGFSYEFYGNTRKSEETPIFSNAASSACPILHRECKALFEQLPTDVRCEILSKRLFHCDNHKIIKTFDDKKNRSNNNNQCALTTESL